MGHPTIYPTGVTVYNPEKCWNGFTIFQALEVGAVLMNMNGRENKVWKGVHGFPNKIFPGGYLMTSRGSRDGRYGVQDGLDLVQIDWDGNVVWKFDRNEYIEDPGIPGRFLSPRRSLPMWGPGKPRSSISPNTRTRRSSSTLSSGSRHCRRKPSPPPANARARSHSLSGAWTCSRPK